MKSSVKFSSSIPRINVGTALCLQITDMMHTKHLVRFRKTLCSVLPEVSIFPATLTWSVTLPTLEPNSPMSQLHYFISADWYLSWLSSGFKETSHGLVFSSVRHRPRLPSVSVCPLPQKVAPPLTLMQLFVTAWLKEIFGGSQKHSSFFSSSHSLFLLRSKTTPVYIYIYIYFPLHQTSPDSVCLKRQLISGQRRRSRLLRLKKNRSHSKFSKKVNQTVVPDNHCIKNQPIKGILKWILISLNYWKL